MSKALYRTANGLTLDIDNLRLVNRETLAVGNMGVNARGDRITSDGTVIETRNEIMKKRYNLQTTVILEESTPVVKTPKAPKVVNQPINELITQVTTEETESEIEENNTTPETGEPTTVYLTGLRGVLANSIATLTQVNVPDPAGPKPSPAKTLKRI